MKTFLLNIPNEIRNWSNTLDAKSVLCNQSWYVFNEEGVKEVYVFQKDGTLIASHNGKVTKAKWEYIPQNTSLIIENSDADTFMLRPTYYGKKVLALQVDGTNNYALMVDEKLLGRLMLDSIETVRSYIMDQSKYQEKIAEGEKKREQEWNKFIDEKVEEYLKTSESLEEIKKIEKQKKIILFFTTVLFLVSLCFIFLPSPLFYVGISGMVVVSVLLAYLIGDLSVSGYKMEIKKKMEIEYPFETFKIDILI